MRAGNASRQICLMSRSRATDLRAPTSPPARRWTRMRIQIASDLHLEILHRSFPGYNPVKPSSSADVLDLAGDLAPHADAVAAFAN